MRVFVTGVQPNTFPYVAGRAPNPPYLPAISR